MPAVALQPPTFGQLYNRYNIIPDAQKNPTPYGYGILYTPSNKSCTFGFSGKPGRNETIYAKNAGKTYYPYSVNVVAPATYANGSTLSAAFQSTHQMLIFNKSHNVTVNVWGAGANVGGGSGAAASIVVSVNPGDIMRIYVGGTGTWSSSGNGTNSTSYVRAGGGGGSFVTLNNVLIIAAGGGGGGLWAMGSYIFATGGTATTSGQPDSSGTNLGGSGGNGGSGGGAGILTKGGSSFINPGSQSSPNGSYGIYSSYGGGSPPAWNDSNASYSSSGGGGGYSGGGSGSAWGNAGGGGGSFVLTTSSFGNNNTIVTAGTLYSGNTGNITSTPPGGTSLAGYDGVSGCGDNIVGNNTVYNPIIPNSTNGLVYISWT